MVRSILAMGCRQGIPLRKRTICPQPFNFSIAICFNILPTFGPRHNGADNKKNNISQIILTIGLGASFFNNG